MADAAARPAAPIPTKNEGSFSTKADSSQAALVGGLLSGPIEAYLLQPTDVIKTKLQTSPTSHGIFRTGRAIYQEEGAAALWKGATPFAMHLALKYCLRWGSATYFKNLLRDSNGALTGARVFAAGAMAGGLEAVVVVTPFEVVKTRLQVQKAHALYSGPVDVVRKVLRHEGIRALWRGLTPTFLRNTINQSTNQLTKPLLDHYVWGKSQDSKQAVWKTAASGFCAGITGPSLNNPMDVAKTRLMAGDPRYKTMVGTILTVAREEGVRSLWKGYLARLARIGPGYAIQWVVIDQVQRAWPS
eukprot:TRINITY_DN7789_c0_g1_i1.p2 TRINITY_DN7789_c0_g1~~TRINITY_DN7789_c0_g1_i1.p2  ORF type:complete len:309 (+),score=109.81 TRINITY_DN7789_c0_g1_i1:26-928(+)